MDRIILNCRKNLFYVFMTAFMMAVVAIMFITSGCYTDSCTENDRMEKEKSLLRQNILNGYDAMMISDYDSLASFMTDDAYLITVEGNKTTKEQILKLAQKIKSLKTDSIDKKEAEAFTVFLKQREDWAKRAKETTEFQTISITDDVAVVTTFDRGTPGKIEKSVYTLRKNDGVWKLYNEVSTRTTNDQEIR